jgi:CheY-like chemotaxis protein
MEKIFEPFVTMKPVGVGTGLGLYICRDIIQGIGGAIVVDSTIGEGTTFTVRLPPAPADAKLAPDMAVPGRKRQDELPRATILVIDDETNIGKSLERSLPEHDITVVDSGREGIRILDEGKTKFDLIFCDVMMPDVTGADVHDHIAKHHPDMLDRIVFMTGGAFTERAAGFIERVSAPRVDKPFELTTIRKVLREKLDPNYKPNSKPS